MGEGTKVFNAQEEIAELKRRIETLEKQKIPFVPSGVHPMGCICPAGAEACCGNMCCPRRSFPGVTWSNVVPVT